MSEIKQQAVAELIPYINNARTHGEVQIAQIAASIKEFGFVNPILTDGAKGVIAGHGRLLAAKKLGMEFVPVIELSHLSKAQKKAYILADNRIALNSGWDADLLAVEIEALKEVDFDVELLGFSKEELDAMTQSTPLAKEKTENTKPIKQTRMLLSIPVALYSTITASSGLEEAIRAAVKLGARVDYDGN